MNEPDAPRYRAGRLLVATPQLGDASFFRAVVLMLEHTDEGALGVILNRPTELEVREVLPETLTSALPLDGVVYQGGPVSPEAVIMLGEFSDSDGIPIAFGEVGVIDPDADFDDLAQSLLSVRVFGGYAGWGAGQLESELQQEAWIDANPATSDVFADTAGDLWSAVLERKGGQYALLARMPDDPSMN
jgi:putative transcriptional regulator